MVVVYLQEEGSTRFDAKTLPGPDQSSNHMLVRLQSPDVPNWLTGQSPERRCDRHRTLQVSSDVAAPAQTDSLGKVL